MFYDTMISGLGKPKKMMSDIFSEQIFGTFLHFQTCRLRWHKQYKTKKILITITAWRLLMKNKLLEIKSSITEIKLDKAWWRSFFLMIAGVIVMGFGVSLLKVTDFGTDPYSAMNYGVSGKLGLTLGTYQLFFNITLLIIVLFIDWKMIGTGTLGNMILVGYSADFCTFILYNVLHIPHELSLQIRIAILVPALIIFVIAAACYMQSDHGTSPYDAIPFIINNKIEDKTHKKGTYKIVRLCYDAFFTIVSIIVGGEWGITTILMVVMLGPTVEFVGNLLHRDKKS